MTSEIKRIEFPDRVEYRLNGKLHREDGPAIEFEDGSYEWYLNGLLHREDGPATQTNGSYEWWFEGLRHRMGGPAVEWACGIKEWAIKGLCHREDGPAVEHTDGTKEWWLKHEKITKEQLNVFRYHNFQKALINNRRSYKYF